MVNQNFTLTRGDSLQFRINFLNTESLPDNIIMSIKDKSSDTTSVLQLQIGDGITKVDDADSYDVILIGISTHNKLMGNFQKKMAIKFPIILFSKDYKLIIQCIIFIIFNNIFILI